MTHSAQTRRVENAEAMALASVTLLESLMLVLIERGLLAEDEIDEVFEDAMACHDRMLGPAECSAGDEIRSRVLSILSRMQVNGNGGRGEM